MNNWTTRSILDIIPAINEPERFLPDANANQSIVAVARRNARATKVQDVAATSAPIPEEQLVDMSPTSALRTMMQQYLESELDHIVDANMKTSLFKAADEGLTDMVQTDNATSTDWVKDVSFRFVESLTTNTAHKSTLNNLLGWNLALIAETSPPTSWTHKWIMS